MANKASHVTNIAEFLGVKNYNVDEIVENTSLENAKKRRIAKLGKADIGAEKFLYRSGKTNSWKDCLTPETLEMYENSL